MFSRPNPFIDYQFFALSIQYFCLARYGSKFPFNPSSGNLYHLSFELFLKGYLLKYFSRKELKSKFSHNLLKLWNEFKPKISNEDLNKYDIYIKNLDVWERVRYISFLDGSNATSIVICNGHAPSEYLKEVEKIKNNSQTTFSLYTDDMDELFQALVFAIKIDPHSLLANQFDMIVGRQVYEQNNKYSIFVSSS